MQPSSYHRNIWVSNPDEVKSSHETTALSPSTLLARKPILQFWKAEAPATFDLWLKELGNVLHVEKIRYVMSANKDTFFKILQPILDLMSERSRSWCCVVTYVLFILFPAIIYNPKNYCHNVRFVMKIIKKFLFEKNLWNYARGAVIVSHIIRIRNVPSENVPATVGPKM